MNLDRCLNACSWAHLWAIGHTRGLAVPRQPTRAELLALVRADLLAATAAGFAPELHALPPDALLALQLLAAHQGWLPAAELSRRFGAVHPFKPWRRTDPPEPAPWRVPATAAEWLYYRGLVYPAQRVYGHLALYTDGFCLPDELAARLPPPVSLFEPVEPPADPAPAPHLFYNLTLFQAHLARHAPRPRQGRWLTPTQFRPVLDRLWPPGCPAIAADRRAQGERATELLRALHYVAEAAAFLPAPAPPARAPRAAFPPAVEEVASMAPPPPAGDGDDGLTVVVGGRARRRPPAAVQPDPDHLLPSPAWHDWLDRPLFEQVAHLRTVLAGQAPGQDWGWRAFQLPGWREAEPLAPLRRVFDALAGCPADGTWVDLDALARRLPFQYVDLLPADVDRPAEPHRALVAGFLAYLGVVQLDRWQAPTGFRLTPWGGLLLGARPNGEAGPPPALLRLEAAPAGGGVELALDPDGSPALLYELALNPGVEWPAPGRARLVPGRLGAAPHAALAGLVRLVDAGLAEPLPDAALAELWQAAGPGLVVRRVTLLESADAALLAGLAGRRGIRRHLRAAYGRRAVEIDSHTLESLVRKLRGLGLAADVRVALDPAERPAAGRRWGAEDAGHLLLAALIYNRLPGRAPMGHSPHAIRPTHYIPDSTLERLAAGLPPRILESVEQMAADTIRRLEEALAGRSAAPPARATGRGGAAGPPDPAATLAAIGRALEQDLVLDVEYDTAGQGDLTRRVVEPLRLEERGGVAYLVAYCRLRRAERVFRVDRLRVLGENGQDESEAPPPWPE